MVRVSLHSPWSSLIGLKATGLSAVLGSAFEAPRVGGRLCEARPYTRSLAESVRPPPPGPSSSRCISDGRTTSTQTSSARPSAFLMGPAHGNR